MNRRHFCATTTSVLAICFSAGCSTLTNPSSTTEPLPNVPTQTEDCEITDLPDSEYPSFPSSVTDSSVLTYSLEFEKAYSSASIREEPGLTFGGFDGSDSEIMRQTKTWFVLKVWVGVDVTEDDGDRTIAGSNEVSAWYYITDDFAVRAPGDSSDSVPATGWETVACTGAASPSN